MGGMRYLLALLLLGAVGCGKAPSEPVVVVVKSEPQITPSQVLAAENYYNTVRKLRDQVAMLAEAQAVTGEHEQSDYYAKRVKRMDVWIRDFERAQDAKDTAAMLRRSAEMRVILDQIEAGDKQWVPAPH